MHDSSKKILAATVALLFLGVLAVLLFSEDGPLQNREEQKLTAYWQKKGLSEEEARYLARQGPSRIDVPASQAAFNENVDELAPEGLVNVLLAAKTQGAAELDAKVRQSLKELSLACQEASCPEGTVPQKGLRASSSFVFWEDAVTVVIASMQCYGSPPKLGETLFSEMYLSGDQWQPRYLLQTLGQAKLPISKTGKEDLRAAEKNFLSACQSP